jgi:flagellar hook assembly protein FlgD
VYDANGRRVRDLASGRHAAGPFTVAWDGRDADGRELASGIYFAKLRAGDFSATRKLVMLR